MACAVLKHVARVYPKALYHPYHITEEFLGKQGLALCTSTDVDMDTNTGGSSSSSGGGSGRGSKGGGNSGTRPTPLHRSLRELLRDESSDALVAALDGLTHPHTRFLGD